MHVQRSAGRLLVRARGGWVQRGVTAAALIAAVAYPGAGGAAAGNEAEITAAQRDQRLPRVLFTTSVGEIEIEVDSVKAPVTAANFLRYVDGGFYDNGRFHRTVTMSNQPTNDVKIEVIQASINSERRSAGFPAITLERTSLTGISHKDGTISMARSGPDTGRSDFFICIGDQPSLDFGGARNADGQGFAAFGRVLRGMDIVRKIQQSPANAQNLTPPISIISARRISADQHSAN